MAFSQKESAQVLGNIPRHVEVILECGAREGKPQFSAPWEHAGKQYRLVISAHLMNIHELRDGETWELRLEYTPNGHIIFCMPIEKKADAENGFNRFLRLAGVGAGTMSDEEGLELIPANNNIFGLQEDGNDTKPPTEMTDEEVERAIEEALSGRQ